LRGPSARLTPFRLNYAAERVAGLKSKHADLKGRLKFYEGNHNNPHLRK